MIVETLSSIKPAAYRSARYQRETLNGWWSQPAYEPPREIPKPKPDLEIRTGYGPTRNSFSRRTLSRLYGISLSRAQHNRATLMRLSLMKPEARRYSLKLILQGEAQ